MCKPTAAYLRISSKGQRHDSQREVVTQWLTANGYDLDQVEWYVDTESGRKMSRPEFDRLNRDIFAGTVKNVVVFKVDRIARRLREGLDILCDWCDRGVRFVSVTQQIDVNGTVGRMVTAMLLGLAELEWEYRRERQAGGIKVKKRADRGKPLAERTYQGRKPGTTKAKPKRAAELRAKGLSVDEIAMSLGVSRRTAWRYISQS
jgi:DNA invertase Pin-like site-specific DNA recombinase